MKISSIHSLKSALNEKTNLELVNYCLRLAKYKKENKELLTYLLFDSENEGYYIESIQDEMREAFKELVSKPRYLRQKLLRKLLRNLKKYIRYSGRKETEIELLIEFCFLIKRSSQDLLVDKIIYSIYHKQLEIVKKRLNQLHEDLQLDYQEQLNELLS
jgi:hypothetical protein